MHHIIISSASRPGRAGNLIAVFLLAVFSLFSCNPSTPHDTPVFTAITSLKGKRFVAYPSPDRTSKPDTVSVACMVSTGATPSIKAFFSIDSGNTWVKIDDPALKRDGDQVSLRWIPGNDADYFSYFGEKECLIRFTDTITAVSIQCDPFIILGPQPLMLLSPQGGETFSVNDTIAVTYKSNSDRISNIRVFFYDDSTDDWIEISAMTSTGNTTAPPLRAFTTRFVPTRWETTLGHLIASPTRILLKDYNSPLPNSSITTGDIFLER